MTQVEFIEKFKTAINAKPETHIAPETTLNTINEWDSLGMACTISMLSEEFGKNIDYNKIESFQTVSDLMDFAGIK